MGAVTPGETLGTLYNIRVGSNKTKQHTHRGGAPARALRWRCACLRCARLRLPCSRCVYLLCVRLLCMLALLALALPMLALRAP